MNKLICAPTSLPRTGPLEYVDAVIGAGFDGMGLRLYVSPNVNYQTGSQSAVSTQYPVTGDPITMRDVRSALGNTGLLFEICSIYVQPEMDMDAIKPPVEFGASLGAKYAMVIGDDPDWPRMVDTFGHMCEVLRSMGVTAALEAPVARRQSSIPAGMMGRINSIEMAVDLIRESGAPNAAVILDPLSFHKLGHSPEVLKEIEPRLLPYTQIRDASGENWGDKASVEVAEMGAGGDVHGRTGIEMGSGVEVQETGVGPVPLAEILDMLPQDLPLSVEWAIHKDSEYTPAEWARHIQSGTRAFLNKYYAQKRERHDA